MSLVNLLILICYKTVINRAVFCEFSESTELDTLQKRDSLDKRIQMPKDLTKVQCKNHSM